MHFFSILCIFATTIVFVQCNHDYVWKHNDYNTLQEIECSAVRKTVINTMTTSICKPHARHVPLKPMPSQEFLPSAVVVNRCEGNCPGHTCVPIQTRMIKVPVKLIKHDDKNQSKMTCALVDVEEHIQCRCKCPHERRECNDKQYYVEDRCACRCKNQEAAKYECEAKMWMLWDENDCSCKCTQQEIRCESGLKWNRNECECL